MTSFSNLSRWKNLVSVSGLWAPSLSSRGARGHLDPCPLQNPPLGILTLTFETRMQRCRLTSNIACCPIHLSVTHSTYYIVRSSISCVSSLIHRIKQLHRGITALRRFWQWKVATSGDWAERGASDEGKPPTQSPRQWSACPAARTHAPTHNDAVCMLIAVANIRAHYIGLTDWPGD